jgi:hypothetical protein
MAIEEYADRRVSSLTAEECRELIAAYGDASNELDVGHDTNDVDVWRAILRDNMGSENTFI